MYIQEITCKYTYLNALGTKRCSEPRRRQELRQPVAGRREEPADPCAVVEAAPRGAETEPGVPKGVAYRIYTQTYVSICVYIHIYISTYMHLYIYTEIFIYVYR